MDQLSSVRDGSSVSSHWEVLCSVPGAWWWSVEKRRLRCLRAGVGVGEAGTHRWEDGEEAPRKRGGTACAGSVQECQGTRQRRRAGPTPKLFHMHKLYFFNSPPHFHPWPTDFTDSTGSLRVGCPPPRSRGAPWVGIGGSTGARTQDLVRYATEPPQAQSILTVWLSTGQHSIYFLT